MNKIPQLPYAFTKFERYILLALSVLLIASIFFNPQKKEILILSQNTPINRHSILFHDSLVKYPLEVNTSSVELLELVPEIGKVTAMRIDSLRKRTPIRDLNQLLQIKGISASKLERLKHYITISDSMKVPHQ